MILVTGGSGVMGLKLVRRLLAAGKRVRVLVQANDPRRSLVEALSCEVVLGDVTDPQSLALACAGIDTVYHLAAIIVTPDHRLLTKVNVEGTRNLLASAANAHVSHFVYVSSASVTYAESTPYSRSKRVAEELVRAQNLVPYTVARPTLVYDTDGGHEFMLYYRYLTLFAVVPMIGSGQWRKRPVWADDVVQALAAMVHNPKAVGKIYNLSGPEALPLVEMARMMLNQRGKSRPFVHLPVSTLRWAARALALVLRDPPLTLSAIAGVTQHADLDPAEAQRDLHYRPISFAEGLRRCFPVERLGNMEPQ